MSHLQHHWYPVLCAEIVCVFGVCQSSVRPRNDGEAGVDGGLSSRHFVAHLGHHRGRRSDKPGKIAGIDVLDYVLV